MIIDLPSQGQALNTQEQWAGRDGVQAIRDIGAVLDRDITQAAQV